MRHFNLAVVAVGALYISMGCGSSGAHLDGGGGDMASSNQDFSTTPPDMAKSPPGCFAVLGNQSLASKATAATKAKVNAFITCALNTCGSTSVVDGGNATKPCAVTVDGGASAACDQCFSNIQVNDQISFVDANNMPIACVPTTSPDCKACATEIVACVLDCNSDADCSGLTHSDGSTSTCDTTMGQCN